MDAFIIRKSRIGTRLHDSTPPASETDPNTRAAKRPKRETDSVPPSDCSEPSDTEECSGGVIPHTLDSVDPEDEAAASSKTKQTEVENVLPASQGEEEALKEYEELKLSQSSSVENATNPIIYKSSIYVDAFNLTLDAVLEEESHLFNEQEKEVFQQWKTLDYESQYLYVRLFLRKTDSWHRSNRLSYASNILNMEKAIASLQKLYPLPYRVDDTSEEPLPGITITSPLLGESFAFADGSENFIKSFEEAASLLSLEELKLLAKDAKVQGRNKAEFIQALSRMCQNQSGLMSLGVRRHNSHESAISGDPVRPDSKVRATSNNTNQRNRGQHFLGKVLDITGPCIRLAPPTRKLFERVHLVFYRSTEWTERSLTTIILARMSRRNFPEYLVCRTSTIFESRSRLLDYEAAIKLESEVDSIIETGELQTEKGSDKVMDIFTMIYPRWECLLKEAAEKERRVYEMGEGAYLRRFTAGHSYTRVIHKALTILARRKQHAKEYKVLCELLDQKFFQMARRGSWYQRKALLEEHYMPNIDDSLPSLDLEGRKKHWKRIAVSTCEIGLQDPDCHLIYHWDLQKRLTRLEKKLRIPKRLQHDFGHVRLADPIEISVQGVQIKRDAAVRPGRQQASTKTLWLDEFSSAGECSVEDMCLGHFLSEGWKGYHSEGGIIRTLFAYLFYDILFLYVPNVFQTPYQTCPLDLHTDAFFPVRASEINRRLVEISNGQGAKIVRAVWEREHERRASVVGLNWDFDIEDIVELVSCFEGSALASVCKVMAQEYRQRGGGIPDLILWRASTSSEETQTPVDDVEKATMVGGEVMFVEVKSANDRLSDSQRLWIHVLTGAGIKVALCNAVAREVREID